jgi:hypothetical protein
VKSHTTARFRSAFDALPTRVQQSARRAYRVFQNDPRHPSLQYKQVHTTRPIFSARVALGYRALCVREGDDLIWFWIGSHSDYDRMLSQFRRG